MTVVVTGANGFVGTHLCQALQQRGMAYRAVVRTAAGSVPTPHTVSLPGMDAERGEARGGVDVHGNPLGGGQKRDGIIRPLLA